MLQPIDRSFLRGEERDFKISLEIAKLANKFRTWLLQRGARRKRDGRVRESAGGPGLRNTTWAVRAHV